MRQRVERGVWSVLMCVEPSSFRLITLFQPPSHFSLSLSLHILLSNSSEIVCFLPLSTRFH